MKYIYIVLVLLIGLLFGCLVKPPPFLAEPQDGSLVIFDGGRINQGKGFALPRGLSKLEISYERPHSDKTHLYYDLKFNQGWTGGGWNWHSWEGDGTNIKPYKNMVFYIAVFQGSISDITFRLMSKNKSGESDGMGPKVSIFPFITKRGKYIRMTIPLEKLIGESLDETAVWGFDFGVFAGKTGSSECRIYLDNVEFTQ